jgi:3-hydroxyacyl-[acyl-carrier-protein] dehydratase
MDQPISPDITRLIPHRYPFVFVDRVAELIPGERIVAFKHFSANEEIARGNPEDQAAIPTGTILELVTQVGAVLVMDRPEMAGKIAMILQIPSATVHSPVYPGDTLRVEAEVVRMRSKFGELKGRLYREGDLVAEGQVRFGIANAEDLRQGGVQA